MLFRRRGGDPDFPKEDRGSGSLDDYKFDLLPAKSSTVIRLAGSDPHQDLLRDLVGADPAETAIARRTAEEERTDAPIEVRLFVGGRIVGPVGRVPRGLESPVNEALSRLDTAGRKPRIPVEIVATRQGVRVDLLMGETR
ncbi:hypothetical protein [Amnibacterium kyonggiense]|uniref:Uncharacterized protein n=1 Tax=Amnibacterium kyonggiense TaxID=595671 RepID=A0A4V3EAA7_9MICO|nr:hypothetical protein [Amnibacterium kyonggiense]TDS75688.1 hypothetical protein CLV52_2795 [Amnibacterium kyonggiense]